MQPEILVQLAFNHEVGACHIPRSCNLHEDPQMYRVELDAKPWLLQYLEVHP